MEAFSFVRQTRIGALLSISHPAKCSQVGEVSRAAENFSRRFPLDDVEGKSVRNTIRARP